MTMHTKYIPMLMLTGALAAVAGGLSGCRGERSDEPPLQLLPDMDDSPKFKNQGESQFFADGRMMRQPVKGTIAFGQRPVSGDVSRKRWLKESVEAFTGVDPKGKPEADGTPSYVTFIPASVISDYIDMKGADGQTMDETAAWKSMVLRGQERFGIYCSVCHGYQGEGGDPANFQGGVVGRRWNYPVPSLMDVKYRDHDLKTGRDGYIFQVIRNGVPDLDPTKPTKMPGYKEKINEADAWAIVAYVRTLQSAWNEGQAAEMKAPEVKKSAQAGEVKP